MEELERKRNELKECQDEVSMLSVSLSSKDSTIKELCSSKKLVSQELEAARQDIKVFEDDREIMKAWCNKAMDKVVRAGHILMKRPDIVVPDDIVADVLTASGTSSKPLASSNPVDNIRPENAPA
jgi:chromosome segregation ATPase